MRRIETYELIERYLLGRTSPDEIAGIESRIKNDPSFAREVEQHRGMQQVINDYSLLDVKETLSRIRNQKKISIKRRNKFYRSMLIVGSCAIIVSLSLLYFFHNNDGAVRPASEAPGASEAFTDTLAPAIAKEETAEHAGTPVDSYQKSGTEKSYAEDNSADARTVPEKDDAKEDIPKDQEAEPVTMKEIPVHGDESVPDTSQNTSPDWQSPSSPPCEIKAGYVTEPSCNNKATGVIRIMESTLITGTPPYQAILNGKYGDSLVFRGLKPGFYRLEIQDASGCLVNLGTVIVGTKDCTYHKNFYPLLEVWEIPLDSKPGIIEIYNKSGLPVYRLRFDGTGPEYWNGNDLSNQALPLGLYFFTVTYDNDDVFQGTVTINR